MHGPNAKLRYDKYMLNKNKPKRDTKGKLVEDDLPKNISDEQADYFAALKALSKK